MEKSTKILLGLGTLAAAGAAVVFYPKKASAAQSPGQPPKGEEPKKEPPPPLVMPGWLSSPPAWWTAPVTPPKGSPSDWMPPKDWVPPWLVAETKSKDPGTVSDEYKAGFNDGFKDAAYSSDWGTSQNKTLYASSTSYKNGYDNGWAEYSKSVKTGSERVGATPKYVRVGGRMIPANRVGAMMISSSSARQPFDFSLPVRKSKPVLRSPAQPMAARSDYAQGRLDGDKFCEDRRRMISPKPAAEVIHKILAGKSEEYQRGFYEGNEACNMKYLEGPPKFNEQYEKGRSFALGYCGHKFKFSYLRIGPWWWPGVDKKTLVLEISDGMGNSNEYMYNYSSHSSHDIVRGILDGLGECRSATDVENSATASIWLAGAPRTGAEHVQEMAVLKRPYVAMPSPQLRDQPAEISLATFRMPFRFAQGLAQGLVSGVVAGVTNVTAGVAGVLK